MALEWVFDNISCFNGDPNKICLFGESAGGASVHLQVLNSKSRKFINTSIIQSGCAIGDWLLQKDAVSVTRKLAKLLGAKTGSDSDALVTLMSASAEDLFRLKSKPQDPDDRRRNLTFTFKPSIEINSPAAFMHESPAKLIMMQAGQIKIPMIFGTTSIDGSVMVANYRHMTDIFNSDLVRLVPQSLSIDPNSHSAKLLAEEIKKFYFGEEKIEEKTVTNFINHQTDFHFSVPQTIAVELHKLHHSESKVFLYEFRFDGELNMYKKFFQMEHIPGAAHADELCYLFKQRSIDVQVEDSSREAKMRRKMCKLWTNFAKFSDPTPDHEKSLPFRWTPSSSNSNLEYLVIDDEEKTKMETNLNEDRLKFWRGVYTKWNRNFAPSKL